MFLLIAAGLLLGLASSGAAIDLKVSRINGQPSHESKLKLRVGLVQWLGVGKAGS